MPKKKTKIHVQTPEHRNTHLELSRTRHYTQLLLESSASSRRGCENPTIHREFVNVQSSETICVLQANVYKYISPDSNRSDTIHPRDRSKQKPSKIESGKVRSSPQSYLLRQTIRRQSGDYVAQRHHRSLSVRLVCSIADKQTTEKLYHTSRIQF